MKTCICCGARCDVAASTCSLCGEASWSDSSVVLQPKDPAPDRADSVADDLDPSPEIPARRRRNR